MKITSTWQKNSKYKMKIAQDPTYQTYIKYIHVCVCVCVINILKNLIYNFVQGRNST